MLNKTNRLLSTPLKILYAALPIIFRAVSYYIGITPMLNAVFIALVLIGAVMPAIDSFSVKNYAPAFCNCVNPRLKAFTFVLAAGFFADFINRCVSVYYVIENVRYFVVLGVLVRTVSALFALLSTVYFTFTAMSLGKSRFDFRNLKILHLAPVIWALARLFEALEQAGVDISDASGSILKYTMLFAALCFFYFFAAEIENSSGAKPLTVMFSNELSFFSLLFVSESVLALIKNGFSDLSYETVLVLTAAAMCVFGFEFRRNIIKNTESEN